MIKRLAIFFLVVAIALGVFIPFFCLTKIEDDEIGVRVNNTPYIHEVEKDNISTAGYYLTFPKLLVIYKMPKTQMTIEMVELGEIRFEPVNEMVDTTKASADEETGVPESPEEQFEKVKEKMAEIDKVKILVHDPRTGNESVRIKTSDGNDVWVDVIVGYRINPVQAHRALKNVGLKSGNFQEEIEQLVNSIARGKIRSYLSGLDTKGVLSTDSLNEAMEKAKARINESLVDFGLEVTSLEPQRVTLHPDYDQVLQMKLVAYEEAEEYKEEAEKAKQLAETMRFKAKGEADALIALARGRKARILQLAKAVETAMEYEADAEGVKYIELANGIEAISIELAASGGDRHVGLAIAEAIQGKPIVIVPSDGSLNMVDVNEILQSYGAAKMLKKDRSDKDAERERDLAPVEYDIGGEIEMEDLPETDTESGDHKTTGHAEDLKDHDASRAIEDVYAPVEFNYEPVISDDELKK